MFSDTKDLIAPLSWAFVHPYGKTSFCYRLLNKAPKCDGGYNVKSSEQYNNKYK